MKTTVKLLAMLAAVIALSACGPNEVPQAGQNSIVYVVASTDTPVMPNTVIIKTNSELEALLDRLCDYAWQGKAVTFYNPSIKAKATKEATSITTTDREELKRWMARMEDAGKTVTVTYDPNSGVWTGTAYAPAPPMQEAGPRLSRVTFDQTFDSTGMACWERHVVYTYTWDGDLLTSVDEEWVSIWRSHDGSTSDTSVYHNTAILTYQNGLCTAIGDVRNTYLGGRLAVQEFPWDDGGVYTFVYNDEGKPVCPIYTGMASNYGSDVMQPVTVPGATFEWEGDDAVRYVNDNGETVCSYEYDNSLRPRGVVIGVDVLLPYYDGFFMPQCMWSKHNITRIDFSGDDYADFEVQYTHDASGRAATAVIPRWTDGSYVGWTFEYVD